MFHSIVFWAVADATDYFLLLMCMFMAALVMLEYSVKKLNLHVTHYLKPMFLIFPVAYTAIKTLSKEKFNRQ